MDTKQKYKSADAARRLERRALWRVRRRIDSSGVNFLNITAMMDMMTILLVFMLKNFSMSSANLAVGEHIGLPLSTTREKVVESVTVTVGRNAIVVEGDPVVAVRRGTIDPSQKKGGETGMLILPLLDTLQKHTRRLETIAAIKVEEFQGEATIVADKSTPYRLLTEVLYTAGEAKYLRYRLVVMQKE